MTNSSKRTPQQEWEDHNQGFHYEPPEKPPELWSKEDYTELYDRVITKRHRWECQKCCKPFSSIEKARRHVENQHAEKLIDRAQSRQEADNGD